MWYSERNRCSIEEIQREMRMVAQSEHIREERVRSKEVRYREGWISVDGSIIKKRYTDRKQAKNTAKDAAREKAMHNVKAKRETTNAKHMGYSKKGHQLPSAATSTLSHSFHPDTPSSISTTQPIPALVVAWQHIPGPIDLTPHQHRLLPSQGPRPQCSSCGRDSRGGKERKGWCRCQYSSSRGGCGVLVVLLLVGHVRHLRVVAIEPIEVNRM
ncbi:hypothetical protein FA13DRAFT_231629 [Coprinellus micaceus]|uniref:Uncharacterized protein n=1 Tax=Coprinellus micaceus TaxID=71717 RepID=A0A4Y7TG51_COPMI|nr:hypothetical protein FA13DRAFT_231629 [Coprinellus micaceus]